MWGTNCLFVIIPLCGSWQSETVITDANGRYAIVDDAPGDKCGEMQLSLVNRRYPESEWLVVPLNRCGNHTVNHDFRTRLVVTPSSASLPMGASQQFIATDSAGTALAPVTWSSSQSSVATVDSVTGRVTGVRWGTSLIKASHDGQIGTASLSVLWAGAYPLPNPVLVYGGPRTEGTGERYLQITNYREYPDELFVVAPTLPPCGSNPQASRTWVYVHDSTGSVLDRFCTLESSSGLSTLLITLSQRSARPTVYVTLVDRLTNTVYRSNSIRLCGPYGPSC
jgi:hypothetical protein